MRDMADRVGTPSWVPEAGHREFEALRTDQFGGRRPGSTQRQLHRAQRPGATVSLTDHDTQLTWWSSGRTFAGFAGRNQNFSKT
jgi:hypothetical protein